jgi:kynurenine 3-monooxygenase
VTGEPTTRIAIVGAGLAGGLLACLLAEAGYEVSVYERRPDPRAKGFVGGRSINLALSARGIHALQRAGLADAVLADAIPMRGRMIHSPAGRLSFQPYSKNPTDAINSVSRGGLNLALVRGAERYESRPTSSSAATAPFPWCGGRCSARIVSATARRTSSTATRS